MRASTSTLHALASHYAESYPYNVQTIFRLAKEIKDEFKLEKIKEVEPLLIKELDLRMAAGY